MGKLSHYRESLKKKGWYFCLQEALKFLFPLRWVRSKAIMDQIYEERAFRYLKKKYAPLLDGFVPFAPTDAVPSKIIWTCWLQGEQNAPDIVRKCIASIRKYARDFEVRVITDDNLSSYVEVPPYIKERLEHHQMQFAQYSDYLRAALLSKYGGIWVDSTVLFTDFIPDKIKSAPFFVFKSSLLSSSPIKASSWFIAAQKNNIILQQVKYLLESYWSREKRLCNYYLFHLLFSCVVEDSRNKEFWKNIPYVSNVDVHRMQFLLFEPYRKELFDEICESASIHKLTYKFHQEELCENEGTIYRYIIGTN